MRKSCVVACIVAFGLHLVSSQVYAQCGAIVPTPTGTYCDNQRAEITLNDPDATNTYEWFRDAAGTLSDGALGSTDGKYHISGNDVPANTPTFSLYYRRKSPQKIGPKNVPTTGGTSASINQADYEMQFTSTVDFVLNSVSVYAKGNNTSATNYGLQVRVVPLADKANATLGSFSNWTKFTGTGNLALHKVVANSLEIKANVPYVIQIRSVTDATAGVIAVDEVYWNAVGTYSATPGIVTITPQTKSVYSNNVSPLISDWDITLKCPLVEVVSTRKTSGCCTPVGNSFSVTSPKTVVIPSDFPFSINATGNDVADANNYYYEWFDGNGNLIANSNGGNVKKQLEILAAGNYKIRVAENASFINTYSCYKEKSISIQKRVLFATASTKEICAGETATLTADGAINGVTWSPATNLSSTTAKIVEASPSTIGKTTYKVSAIVPIGNIVIDGDFDESTVAAPKFQTTYTLQAEVGGNNQSTIGTRAYASWDPNNPFCDNSAGFYSAERGKFLFADAAAVANNVSVVPADWGQKNYIWRQSNLAVVPNTTYTFRFLVTDWGVEDLSDPKKTANVQMFVNDQPLLVTPFEVNQRCKWLEVTGTWNSGSATQATLTIADVNAQDKGGEYAIDDISFGAPGIQEDTVSITVKDCSKLVAKANPTSKICIGDPVNLWAETNGFIEKWETLAGKLISNFPTATVYPTQDTTYKVTARFTELKYFSNPDFSKGNTDVSSPFTLKTANGIGDNEYAIVKGTEGWYYDPIHKGVLDHSGTGNYMLVRTKTGADRVLFSKSVTATIGDYFGVSLFFVNLHERMNQVPDAKIKIQIGTESYTVTAPQDRDWHSAQFIWKATASGPITIQLVSPKETVDQERVLGIDDLYITKLSAVKTDQVTVTVKDCFYLDTLITGTCQGDSVKIGAKTNGLFLGWTVKNGAAKILTPKDPITWVKPTVPSVLEAKASYQIGNLVSNGDFEAGDKDFTSDYTCCLTSGGGHYSIDYSADGAGFAVKGKKDHTTGKGKMYLSDGGSDPTKAVYRNTVDVEVGKQYAFSAWLANIHTNFASAKPDTLNQGKTTYLAFYINGKYQNAIKLPLDTAWHQYYSIWTSDVAGPVTIEIKDQETSPAGNDFALDDIIFAPLAPTQKTVTVKVPACVVCNLPTKVEITKPATDGVTQCEGTDLALEGRFANGGKTISAPAPNNHMYYAWYKKGVAPTFTAIAPDPTGTGNVAVPDGSFTNLALKDSGTYYLRVQDGNSLTSTCFNLDSVKVHLNAKIKGNWIDSSQTVCESSLLKTLKTKKDSVVSGNLNTPIYAWLVAQDVDQKSKYVAVTSSQGTTNGGLFTPASLPGIRYFKRVAYAAGTNVCQNDTSTAIKIQVDTLPKRFAIGANQTICKGAVPNQLTGKARAAQTKYHWLSATAVAGPYTKVANATSNSYTPTALKVPTWYRRIDTIGTCFKISDSVKVSINDSLSKTRISGGDTVCLGATVAKLNGQTTPATALKGYNWQVSVGNTSSFVDVSPVTTSEDYLPNPSAAGTYYYVRQTLAADATAGKGCPDSTSNSIVIKVDPPVTPGTLSANAPNVCKNQVLKAGNITSTLATGSTNSYSYTWQVSTTSAATGFVNIPANQNAATDKKDLDYTETITESNTYFRRIDSAGACFAITNVLTISGKDALKPGTIGKGDTVCYNATPGKIANLTDAAGGTGSSLNYQWQSSTDNVAWKDVGSATQAELTFAQSLKANTYYRRRAAKGLTTCDTSYTNSVYFMVVDSAVAKIATPVSVTSTSASPQTGDITYRDTLFEATAETPLANYNGTWSATFGNKMPNGTSFKVNAIKFNESSVLSWTVQDVYQVCPAAVAKLTITRKDFTTAKLEEDKNLCITPANGLTIKGLSKPQPTMEYASWSVKPGSKNATINVPDSRDSSQATFTADGGAGIYLFYYTITNKLLGKTTKDSISIRVDDATVAPSPYLSYASTTLNFPFDDPTKPYFVCTSDLTLKGIASTQSALSKTWWETVSGSVDPITDSSASSDVKNLSGKAYLTINYKNGVCPSVAKDFYIEKVADITKTIVGVVGGVHTNRAVGPSNPLQPIDSLCVGGAYTLKALLLPNDPPEKGKWTVVGGTSIGLTSPLDDPIQPLNVKDTGVTEITWEIANTNVSCAPNTVTFKLVARQAPKIKALTGDGPLCEDTEGKYSVSYDSVGLAVTRQWRATLDSAGNKVNAFVQTNSTLANVTYKFASTATSGTSDNGFVFVKVANLCGADYATKEVQVDLRPKGITVAFVAPTTQICASDAGPVPYEVSVSPSPLPNGTELNWYWDGDLLATVAAPLLTQELVKTFYANKSGNIPLQVKLKNTCGEAIAGDKAWSPVQLINIQQSKPLDVTLVADVDNKVCIPTGGIKNFTATPETNGNSLVAPIYHFYIDGNGPFQNTASPQYTATQLEDSSVVKVVLEDAKGCFDGMREAKDSVVVEGFQYPDSSIVPTTPTTACEDPSNPVVLTVKRTKTKLGSFNDNGNIAWLKDGDTVALNTNTLRLTNPDQRGSYKVVIGRNVCSLVSTSKDAVPVMIYDRPDPIFGQDPLLIYYKPGIQAQMPLLDKGTRDPLIDIEWTPATWLNSPDSLKPILLPTRDERTIDYQVILYTGEPGVACAGTASIKVINTLPLEIPNAFSPNGDGLNDVWVIEGLGKYPNTRVKVFNRWGNSMYIDSNGYKASWDGNHNGYPLPAGTYYYLVELRGSPDDTDHDETGSITLVR